MDPDLHAVFQQLAQRARGLDELLAIGDALLMAGAAVPDGSRPAAVEILDSWQKSYARGDRGAFEQRLEWDGLTYEIALDRLAAALAAAPAPLPAWIDPLVQVLGGQIGSERSAQFHADPSAGRDIPFAPLWAPFVRYAGDRLWEGARDFEGLIGGPARDGLETQLLGQLSRASESAVLAWYDDYRASAWASTDESSPTPEATSGKIFQGFLDSMFSGAFLSFFLRYPVVARQACTLIHTWISAEQEFLSRLGSDLRVIEETFHGGQPVGAVEEIHGSMSDRHHGGRRVHGLRFASGLRLIYKPRDIGTEVAFQDLLTWLRETGLDSVPSRIVMLERDGYGWAEFIDHGDVSDIENASSYYRKAGCHLCLGYLLCAADLHMDNVIATPEGPVLVDLELILRPALSPVSSEGKVSGEGDGASGSGPLDSGYLTSLRVDPAGDVYDIGGLYGLGGHLAAVRHRICKNPNTDAMRYEDVDIQAAPEKNVLRLAGRPLMAEVFAGEILEGFSSTYRHIMTRKEAFLAGRGPLSAFAGRRIRMLLRDSNLYGRILNAILSAPFQKAGHFSGILMDSMNRGTPVTASAPPMWPVARLERLAMERLDVPYFSMTADRADLLCDDDVVVPATEGRSGIDAVTSIIRGLDDADLEKQILLLRAALPSVPWGSGPYLEVPEEPRRSRAQRVAPMIRAAWGVAEQVRGLSSTLLRDAPAPPPDDVASIDPMRSSYFYDGTAGVALFLAALAHITNSPGDRTLSLRIVRDLEISLQSAASHSHPLPVGACNGLGGIVYALSVIGSLLVTPECWAVAGRAAARIDPEWAGRTSKFDVEGGLAGAILGLLALHEVAPHDSLTRRARQCADSLMAHARPGPSGGAAWPGPDGIARAGFAHGAAGIAYALGKLAAITGDETYRSAAMDAIAFERTLYDHGTGNWPIEIRSDSGEPDRRIIMNAWCHGAPGIALSRVGLIDLTGMDLTQDGNLRAEAESALIATLRADLSDKDHLCCGNMGRIGVLHWSGQVLGNLDVQRASSARVLVVLERALTKGRFTVPSDDTTGAHPSAGFFRGLSGVGYEILRQIEPLELPCALLFRSLARGQP